MTPEMNCWHSLASSKHPTTLDIWSTFFQPVHPKVPREASTYPGPVLECHPLPRTMRLLSMARSTGRSRIKPTSCRLTMVTQCHMSDAYCKLLLSARSNYNAQYAPKGRSFQPSTRAIKQEVYTRDIQETDEDPFDPGMYNLDSSAASLQANVHEQVKALARPPHLTGQQWKSLHPDARVTWDQLPDKAKAIILGMQKSNNRQSANLHEISAYDFIQANLHELQLGDPNDTNNSPAIGPASAERSPMSTSEWAIMWRRNYFLHENCMTYYISFLHYNVRLSRKQCNNFNLIM